MKSDVVISGTDFSPYQFGDSLAACGDELLISAPYRYYAARQSEGIPPPAVDLFSRDGSQWKLAQRLAVQDALIAEGFGRAIVLGKSFAIVGAPGYENGDGPVYVFERSNGALFHLVATFDSPERSSPQSPLFSEYGAALASDDRTLIVGAPLENGIRNGEPMCEGGGVVYVFDCSKPSNQSSERLQGGRPRENFGSSLALDGDFLVVGASAAYSNEQLPGAAYVYARGASADWHELCRVEGRAPGEMFGSAVAIHSKHFAVAARGRPDLDRPVGGRVDLFELGENGGCTPTATIQQDPGFGYAIAFSKDRLAIGQPDFQGPNEAPQTGRVGLFRMNDGKVTHERWLAASSPSAYGRLGSGLALGPDYIAAGAPGLGEEDDWSGFVVVSDFPTS